ncbi:uncharacterized protein [Rutidosis leptorrhynchoides]|uniref:uncharacterized protein isoform X2 n=1 Tax=Rutidosis leptorrhynchoides TaxID=125765 RepID=UPI003A996FFB
MKNNESSLQVVPIEEQRYSYDNRPDHESDGEVLPPGISVTKFDNSIENYFKVMNKMLELSGETEFELDQNEINRISSSTSFITYWRQFSYEPRAVRFACESGTPGRKDVTDIINLTQFSSATVPKDLSDGNTVSSHLRKDFVMHVGGLIWALDWCPRVHQRTDCEANLEFIAIASHPPKSPTHKIGAPLTGRGIIQIWGLLNPGVKEGDVISQAKKKLKKSTSNFTKNSDDTQQKRPRGRPRKIPVNESAQLAEDTDTINKPSAPKKPRGRPKKNPIDTSQNALVPVLVDQQHNIETIDFLSIKPVKPKQRKSNMDGDSQYPKPLAIEFPEDSLKLGQSDEISHETPEIVSVEDGGSNCSDLVAGLAHKDQQKKPRKRTKEIKKPTDEAVDDSKCSNKQVHALAIQFTEDENSSEIQELVTEKGTKRKRKNSKLDPEKFASTDLKSKLTECKLGLKGQDPMRTSAYEADSLSLQTYSDRGNYSMDVVSPRLIMCLAHNGEVAWDVKWRPFDTRAISKHKMGQLAVLLGNGALEVWEVPHPRAVEAVFSAGRKEGTDPRFIKLEPIFMCSFLKCGDRQSIPLTVEWSTSYPHDLILAGCHDGVVALWKFSPDGPLKDTRPLLCFSADTVPIRALAWAPVDSDLESANIIVTAGHKGAKFWDLRDPFRPLWDVNPVQRIIYSLDWLPDPRCVVLSFDDGEIRIISLSKAACDVAVTGTPFVGTQQQGLHSYHCSSSSIWSVQVSRLNGMVAYCCSNGTVLQFQLTTKAVDKDPRRNREPHYLCGALTMEGSVVTIVNPLPDIPFPMKKSSNEWGNTPRSRRGFLAVSNQEKRAREQGLRCQTPEDQPLALCYNNDGGSDPGSDDDTSVPEKSKNTAKTKPGSKKGSKTDSEQASSTRTNEVPEIQKEAFPPKMVAMHRVRWNMNKGSESWLCYGGAAGIVRCQQII